MKQEDDGKETSHTTLWVVLGVILIVMTLAFIVRMYAE